MFKTIYFLLALLFLSKCDVISRNNKIQEIYDKYEAQIQVYTELLEQSQKKVEEDFKICIHSQKETNCSKLKVWEHERSKHSKNITNMQQKIKSHQKTIQSIIHSNQEETHKKSLTIKRLLPELIKAKNDIEYIEGIQFLIQDTYLNIENKQESIMNIFDIHFGNPVQTQLAQMLAKRYDHDPGARPQQAEYLPEKPEEEPPVPKKDYFQGPPLIDEVIFDGHNEHYPEATVRDLFNSLGGVEELPVADLIPEGVNVPEHDSKQNKMNDIVNGYKEKLNGEEQFENLQVIEIQPGFKAKIKQQGQVLYDQLEQLKKSLQTEQDRAAQAIADLEKAILNLHTRHAKQIVQIYLESKRLQRLIFEKDDIILNLDSMIHDCTNMKHKSKKCEQNRILTQVYISDLQQQKDLNLGILKELSKLHQFQDKNIEAPVIPEEEMMTSAQGEAIKKEIEQSQKEMHQIAKAEEEVKSQPLEKPVKQKQEKIVEKQEQQVQQEEPQQLEEQPVQQEEPQQLEEQQVQQEEPQQLEEQQVQQEVSAEEQTIEQQEKQPQQQEEQIVQQEVQPQQQEEQAVVQEPAQQKEQPQQQEEQLEQKQIQQEVQQEIEPQQLEEQPQQQEPVEQKPQQEEQQPVQQEEQPVQQQVEQPVKEEQPVQQEQEKILQQEEPQQLEQQPVQQEEPQQLEEQPVQQKEEQSQEQPVQSEQQPAEEQPVQQQEEQPQEKEEQPVQQQEEQPQQQQEQPVQQQEEQPQQQQEQPVQQQEEQPQQQQEQPVQQQEEQPQQQQEQPVQQQEEQPQQQQSDATDAVTEQVVAEELAADQKAEQEAEQEAEPFEEAAKEEPKIPSILAQIKKSKKPKKKN